MCFFGMTSTCVGACGLISSNARVCSSSYTFFDGTSPRIMRQNKQSAMFPVLLELVAPIRRILSVLFQRENNNTVFRNNPTGENVRMQQESTFVATQPFQSSCTRN